MERSTTKLDKLNRFLICMPDSLPYTKHAPSCQQNTYKGVRDDLRYMLGDESMYQSDGGNYTSVADMTRGWSGRYRLRLCEMIARQRQIKRIPQYKLAYLDEIEAQLLTIALEIGMDEESW